MSLPALQAFNKLNMHIFFEENLENALIELSPEESRHCAKVLRLKAGDVVGFVDGKGTFAQAELMEVSPKSVSATITRRQLHAERNFRIHMAVAPTKNIDRFEWFLEKATECGVEAITPLICAQSERTVVKPDRLQKIMLAAMKQSQRTFLPLLHEAVRFRDFLAKLPATDQLLIAHCDEGEKNPLREVYQPGRNVVMLVGPEGDFQPQEVQWALEKGGVPVSLGQARLRTETAALVACMQLNFLNGEL